MPSSETVKTASALRFFLLAGLALAVGGVVVMAGVLGTAGHAPGQATLRVGTHRYSLRVVTDAAAQARGLGGVRVMPKNEGMLFWFTGASARCFWMKDMRFPLDIVWLDSAKHVVHMEQNVSPDTYPKEFCPAAPARYVVELNAGQARAAGIRKGQTLTF